LAEDENAEWFMDYHNADGSIAEMCGNGIRVFVRYLLDHGLVELESGDTLAIGTRAGVRDVQRSTNGFQVDLGCWLVDGGDSLGGAEERKVVRPGLGMNVGNPHAVVAHAAGSELASAALRCVPRIEPAPMAGANVEFVLPHDPLESDGNGR